ncbi:PQQ-binding-like beta-propeller repeat protein [Streptomyces roseoverticillatus]|uniref:outer membrane protein assembly factor BamB family protein n=1 Tax=Streptomyces roseoverticillatus TaxID=66429 RepID=UPI0033C27268
MDEPPKKDTNASTGASADMGTGADDFVIAPPAPPVPQIPAVMPAVPQMPAAPPLPVGAPPPVRPASPRRTGLIVLAVALAVLLVASLGAGVWMFVASKKAVRAGGSRSVSWSLPYTRSGLEHPRMVRGLWFTGEAVVKALPDRVVGLDPKRGKQLWEAPTPGSGSVMCQASADSTGDVAVLARGSGEDCHTFYAVDLTSGRTLWEHALDADEWAPDDTPRIARSGDVVVVSAKGGLTTAFRVSDGKQLWKDDDKGLYEGADDKDTCRGRGYTGGKQLVRIRRCLVGSADTASYAEAADPATGRAKWRHKLGEHGTSGQVLATSPVVVDDPDQPFASMRLTVLGDDGTVRTRLEGEAKRRYALSGGDGSAPASDVQVKGDKLVMTLDPEEDDSDDNNRMAAWSLTTGKRLWEKRATGYLQTFHLVASESDDILAYVAGNIHDAATLVRFDADTGARTVVRRYRPTPSKAWIGSDPYPVTHGRTLYLSAGYVTEEPGTGIKSRQKSLIALPAS